MFRAIAILLFLLPVSTALAVEDNGSSERFADLQSVQAFDQLLATLAEMRDMILEDAVDEREASEGMRFLLRTVAMSQEVTGDGYPRAPHFARMDTPRRKIGGEK